MKKLMIAAAAAAMVGGAFAGICGEEDTPVKCFAVYKYTFTGKTTIGSPNGGTDNLCGEATAGCVVRIPGSFKVQGWEAYCFCDCKNTIGSGVFDAAAFWQTKPYKADIPDAAVNYDFVNVIGKKGTQAEAAGKFGGTVTYTPDVTWNISDALVFAGIGKYVAKKATYSISGYFAGAPVASWYIKGNVCEQTHVWDCATMTIDCEATPNTVAYGKWSVKYSASDSNKYMKGKLPAYPSYVVPQVAE